MRALAQDRLAAQLMGVDVDRYSMIGFAPVSYTHLDVYKRQAVRHAGRAEDPDDQGGARHQFLHHPQHHRI